MPHEEEASPLTKTPLDVSLSSHTVSVMPSMGVIKSDQ